MTLLVEAATEEHDAGVVALFENARVPIASLYWERAYSSDNPSNFSSTPVVAVTPEGLVAGFAAARPVHFHVGTGYAPAQVLHDIVAMPGSTCAEAISRLLTHLLPRASLTLVAGAGLELAPILQAERLQWAGNFHRVRIDPRSKAGKEGRPKRSSGLPLLPFTLTKLVSFPAALERLNESMILEGSLFRQRRPPERDWMFRGPVASEFQILAAQDIGPCDAYAVLRQTPAADGSPEWHVVDFACPEESALRLTHALADLSRQNGVPLYATYVGDLWNSLFLASGFEALPPRWPLFWALGDARTRDLGNSLMDRSRWFFTAADGEVDHW